MKIEPSVTQQRQTTARKQKQMIEQEQAEMAQLQKFHQEKKLALQLAQEQEISKLRAQQLKANQEKQKEIAAMSEQLIKIRQQGEEEAAALSKQQELLQKNYFQQNQMLHQQHAEQQAAILEAFTQEADDLRYKTSMAREQMANLANEELVAEQDRHQRLLAQQTRNHGLEQRNMAIQQEQTLLRENAAYQQQLKALQKDHFDQLERVRQMHEEQNRSYQQNFDLTSAQQKQYYQDQRLKEDQSLQKNYLRHRQQLAASLADIEQKMAQSIVQAQQNAAYAKANVENKLLDSFYRFEQLPATLQEDAEGASLAIKVPPHEKNNVLLRVAGRNLRLSFSRRVEEKLPQASGMGRYARSESLAQEFNTQKILDPKSVQQTYKDGILTFRIKNA